MVEGWREEARKCFTAQAPMSQKAHTAISAGLHQQLHLLHAQQQDFLSLKPEAEQHVRTLLALARVPYPGRPPS